MPRGPNGEYRLADVTGAEVMVAKIATGKLEDTHYKQPTKVNAGRAGAKHVRRR